MRVETAAVVENYSVVVHNVGLRAWSLPEPLTHKRMKGTA